MEWKLDHQRDRDMYEIREMAMAICDNKRLIPRSETPPEMISQLMHSTPLPTSKHDSLLLAEQPRPLLTKLEQSRFLLIQSQRPTFIRHQRLLDQPPTPQNHSFSGKSGSRLALISPAMDVSFFLPHGFVEVVELTL